MKLQKQEQTSLINTLTKDSNRAVTLEGVWNSKEISFKKIEVEHSMGIVKTILLAEVLKMVQLLKAHMQEVHIDYFIRYILQHYYSYTISDITALTDRLVMNNPYGKPILQNLIHELDKYSTQKHEYAEMQRVQENSLNKQYASITNEFVLKAYEAIKSSPKPITQKEKDLTNRQKLEQKLLEIKSEYPNDF